MKKAQISIFLIISVIIISIFIFLISLNTENKIEILEKEDLPITNVYKENLDKCYETAYYESLRNIGFNGGIFIQNQQIPINIDKMDNYSNYSYVPYLINNLSVYPTLEEIEIEFEEATKYYFFDCIENLNNTNIKFERNENSFEINFDKNKIKSELNIPITINENNQTIHLNKFIIEDDYSYFINYYDIAVNLTQIQNKHLDKFCISCIYEIENENNIKIDTTQISNEEFNIIVYQILNKNLEYNDIKLFSFMHIISNEVIEND